MFRPLFSKHLLQLSAIFFTPQMTVKYVIPPFSRLINRRPRYAFVSVVAWRDNRPTRHTTDKSIPVNLRNTQTRTRLTTHYLPVAQSDNGNTLKTQEARVMHNLVVQNAFNDSGNSYVMLTVLCVSSSTC